MVGLERAQGFQVALKYLGGCSQVIKTWRFGDAERAMNFQGADSAPDGAEFDGLRGFELKGAAQHSLNFCVDIHGLLVHGLFQ